MTKNEQHIAMMALEYGMLLGALIEQKGPECAAHAAPLLAKLAVSQRNDRTAGKIETLSHLEDEMKRVEKFGVEAKAK